MLSTVFFKKKSCFINSLFSNFKSKKNIKINNVRVLKKSKKFDLTFFDSIKYKPHAAITKASFCITTKKLEKFLPKDVERIIVKSVLLELATVLKKIYTGADIDYPDLSLKIPAKKNVIPETIKSITDDPLMQSIFADTARTTLQEQSSAEKNPRVLAGDRAARIADESDPIDMFGEAAGNWATLAFSEKKLPGQHK